VTVTAARWQEAQATEPPFWAGMVSWLPGLLRVLADNAAKAHYLSTLIKDWPRTCLEVGIGPFGVGIIGFLPQIERRFAIDPADRTPLSPGAELHDYVAKWRAPVQYIVACGESIPFQAESTEMVICCNVVDHALAPERVLFEIHRVLRPGGLLFFDVDTFSVCGLIKWYCWTRPRRSQDILVRAHTYRMFEPFVRRSLRKHGFVEIQRKGHTLASLCFGHSRVSTFLLQKRTGGFPAGSQ
jgi:ubiquinone/menaquinone biosynthesis C-methylase UbiE